MASEEREEPGKPDPIDRGFFREGHDGAVVFFPWGVGQRGVRLPDAAARRRAGRGARLLVGGVVAIGTWAGHALHEAFQGGGAMPQAAWQALAAPALALGLLLLGYGLWAARFVEPFPPSDLRLSREERLREAARLAEPRKVAAIGVVVAALGVAVAAIEPRAWPLAGLAVALGAGLVAWSRALRRAAR